jgi:hypothetical protein
LAGSSRQWLRRSRTAAVVYRCPVVQAHLGPSNSRTAVSTHSCTVVPLHCCAVALLEVYSRTVDQPDGGTVVQSHLCSRTVVPLHCRRAVAQSYRCSVAQVCCCTVARCTVVQANSRTAGQPACYPDRRLPCSGQWDVHFPRCRGGKLRWPNVGSDWETHSPRRGNIGARSKRDRYHHGLNNPR